MQVRCWIADGRLKKAAEALKKMPKGNMRWGLRVELNVARSILCLCVCACVCVRVCV